MPRANRYFLPGHIWHITHRCHQQEFLLKFAKDRQRWRYWLFEARKRYGICVLNYVVTSNHIHLLVCDKGDGEIAKSMQLISGRTAQEYNQRKGRRGAYWEDRYHATALDTGESLRRCLVYIDLNMVRAGVVKHPCEWDACGYGEIQEPPMRYAVIDQDRLTTLFGMEDFSGFQKLHRQWIREALQAENLRRDATWTDSLAVGCSDFVERFKLGLGTRARYRIISDTENMHVLREPKIAYQEHFGAEKVM